MAQGQQTNTSVAGPVTAFAGRPRQRDLRRRMAPPKRFLLFGPDAEFGPDAKFGEIKETV